MPGDDPRAPSSGTSHPRLACPAKAAVLPLQRESTLQRRLLSQGLHIQQGPLRRQGGFTREMTYPGGNPPRGPGYPPHGDQPPPPVKRVAQANAAAPATQDGPPGRDHDHGVKQHDPTVCAHRGWRTRARLTRPPPGYASWWPPTYPAPSPVPATAQGPETTRPPAREPSWWPPTYPAPSPVPATAQGPETTRPPAPEPSWWPPTYPAPSPVPATAQGPETTRPPAPERKRPRQMTKVCVYCVPLEESPLAGSASTMAAAASAVPGHDLAYRHFAARFFDPGSVDRVEVCEAGDSGRRAGNEIPRSWPAMSSSVVVATNIPGPVSGSRYRPGSGDHAATGSRTKRIATAPTHNNSLTSHHSASLSPLCKLNQCAEGTGKLYTRTQTGL
ncbi:uncharacterized protein [Dermacentor andersoni]|uniref:uncharacterized protein isoform X3 n=1 Tax=Dermacentor andersoni TaxID=34620 RepID=UPI003B3B6470